ncbi:MAG TPA: hypothetical protein VN258_09520, partial [Mobilitalea sp.]|nr:hypothetical protein [Mobilitalea sp.]
RNNFLSDVTQILNQEIVEEWKNLKAGFSGFSEDSSELELKIIYENKDGKHIFKFKVVDSENEGKERHFNISERSKGFLHTCSNLFYYNQDTYYKFSSHYANEAMVMNINDC